MVFTRHALRCIVFLALPVWFAAVLVYTRRTLDRPKAPVRAQDELVYLPAARHLRPLSLGYHNVLADILWFRAISYFGQHYLSDKLYPWLAQMCELVTDLDPQAIHVYRFAGFILPWEAASKDDGIRLLEKGVRVFPDSWLLHYWLGFNYYFFKNDIASATKHLELAMKTSPEPHRIARIVTLFYRHQHGARMTQAFLESMRGTTDSPEVARVLESLQKEAQAAAELERVQAAVDAYRGRFERLPGELADLVAAGLIDTLPADPFGGVLQLDPQTGSVKSSTGQRPRELHESEIKRKFDDEPAR